MEKITTATGKQFDCSSLSTIPSRGMAYVRIANSDLETVVRVFGDPSETEILRYEDYVVAGYSKLLAIVLEGNIIRVNLKEE